MQQYSLSVVTGKYEHIFIYNPNADEVGAGTCKIYPQLKPHKTIVSRKLLLFLINQGRILSILPGGSVYCLIHAVIR